MTAKRVDLEDPALVWGSSVDEGTWWVQVTDVERPEGVVSDYGAVLAVFKDDEVEPRHEEGVMLAYGAMFGPDLSDVAVWQQKALTVIDGSSS